MITPEAVPSSPDIGSLTSADTTPDRAVMDNMAGLTRGKIQAEDKLFSEEERDIDRHRGAMEKAFQASGVEAEKLQPWNAKEAEEKFFHNPVEAFGSLGSVFALVASAFTHAPMENALNGSAAAMNAIREGDEKAYTRAYTAWKDNMALVEKRHQMQQDLFNDATALMKTDMAAGTVKAQNLAARFGDRQSLMLLEAGMSKEFFDLQAARQKQMEGMIKLRDADMESSIRRQVLTTDPDFNSNDPNPAMRAARKLRAFNRAYNVKETPQQEILGQYLIEHAADHGGKGPTAEELAEFYNTKITKPRYQKVASADDDDKGTFDFTDVSSARRMAKAEEAEEKKTGRPMSAEAAFTKRFFEQHPNATDDDFIAKYAEFQKAKKGGASGVLTPGRQEAAAVEERAQRLMKEAQERGETLPHDEAYITAKKEVQLGTRSPSGNKLDDLKSRLFRVGEMRSTIDKVEALLVKHKAMSGLGGTITRPGEVVSNWFGSDATDRAQFQSWVSELRELAPRILNDSSGRPLAGEKSQIDKIVRGLSPGDTTANTARALYEFKDLLGRIEGNLKGRMGGKPGEAPAQVPESEPAWMKAPIVGGQ